MTSPHRFLSNDRNAAAAAGATVAASSILPAEATAFPLARTRQGSGRAIVAGGYTGAADAELEIEVVSASGSGLLSAPTFAGAGNGALSDLAAAGVPAQTFTVLLASAGVKTEPAALPFYGVTLKAKATGAAGNGIEIAVDASGLAFAAAVYSFLDAATAGDSEFSGPEWDFGAYPLTAAGELDPRTPRLRFGHDPQIYRQYKTQAEGEWKYVVDPPIVRDLPAETPVYVVTGSYAVTVTQGATVETYASIVALFDLLNALKTRSNLIEVDGVVVADKTPGGMAAEDLPARTDAYALPARYEGGAAFPGLGAVTAPADATTQIVTLTCTDIATLGGELWSVQGSVSGDLPGCQTGKPYNASGYGWTIPVVAPEETAAPTGKIYVKSIDFVSRGDGEEGVELCVRPLVAGAKAKPKTVTVTYTKKPPKDCPCDSAQVSGTLSEKCLGVKIDGETSMALVAGYQTRLETLYGWRADFVAANTAITSAGELRAAQHDLQLCDIATTALAQCLADLFGASSTPDSDALTAWDAAMTGLDSDLAPLEAIGTEAASAILIAAANTAYTAGDVRRFEYGDYQYPFPSSTWNSRGYRYYRCSASGTTAARALPYPYSTTINLVDFGTSSWDQITAAEASVWSGGDNQDINAIVAVTSDPGIARDPQTFAKRYEAKMDRVRALAGIVPKSEAGGGGSDCWQPCDGDFEWRVNGLEYLPACTNVPYHSCVMVSDAKGEETVVSTQEFGFVIRVGCPDKIKEGDAFTFVIETDAAPVKTYAVGDSIKIPVVAGQALELAGGVDGDDTLTWTVRGSLGAAWPDYAAETGAEPLYDEDGLQFRIRQGGIPFALGDAFTFAIAGGTFRWRMNAGAWSGNVAIGATPAALQDGLSVLLSPGPDPAFVAGDAWAFAVKQPHAPALALSPARGAWRWAGTGATWTAAFAADAAVSAVAIWHDCPAGATFSVQGLSAADAVLWTKAVAWRAGLTVAIFEGADAVADCRKVRLTVASAAGGSVKWLWCGAPWIPAHEAATLALRESWRMSRGVSAARYGGRGAAGEIAWDVERSWLESADWAELLALLDHLKSHHDEPLAFVPSAALPAEARLVRIGADEVDATDFNEFLYDPRRAISVRVPLAAVPL